MRHRLYLHFVWTTRDREPLITREVADFLDRYLRDIALQERSLVLACGMVKTHVHVLARIDTTTSIPRLVQRWKGGSATLTGKEGITRPRGLGWAKWYSVTSVSPKQLPGVAEYVCGQPMHHPEKAISGWAPAASAVDAKPRL